MKQPHEGVTGTDRPDEILVIDSPNTARRDTRAFARIFMDLLLCHSTAPLHEKIWDRAHSPRVGDLVFVMDYLYRDEDDRTALGIGYLVENRKEWWDTDYEYQQILEEDPSVADEPRSVDEAWYIQYGPKSGDVCRWTNCRVIALPSHDREWELE